MGQVSFRSSLRYKPGMSPESFQFPGFPVTLPAPHRRFLLGALPLLAADARIVGVAAAGSYACDAMDDYSDLDLVIAVEPDAVAEIMGQRQQIADALGELLTAFTGEHVGEPRLLIALYGPEPLHVDLKFVALADAMQRVDQPRVLWERNGRLSAVLGLGEAGYPPPDAQWIEDRFWVWVHYAATKIGRGEYFDALEMVGFLRWRVLGPLGLAQRGRIPSGVRRIEQCAPEFALALQATVATPQPGALVAAIDACIAIYRGLREARPLQRRSAAEHAAEAYLRRIALQATSA
jgi:hypothetical protein